MGLFDFLRASPNVPEIQDENAVKKNYRYWRFRIFIGMYVGYIFYYFTRKSYSCAMPALMTDLGFDKGDLGILGSILSVTYGASKFLSGILADRSNPRFFMGIGLILTGIFNICFGLSSSIFFFAIFWGLNGLFQGWGWPPCARLLTHWYSQKERGTWWGIWNTSQSVGGAVIPVIVASCVAYWNWRYALFIPGVMCIGIGLFVLYCLRDTPQSLGLPPIEKFRNDYPSLKAVEEAPISAKEVLFKFVLNNRYLWLLAISYFFLYVIRTGINDWGLLYFVETKGYSLMTASTCIGAFEVGGFFGSLVAGTVSDKIFKGRRGPVNTIYSIGIVAAVLFLWSCSTKALYWNHVSMFSLGFLVFGPQMLIGMVSAEVTHKKAAGTASGFAGCWSYAGAAMAGYPLGMITERFGWAGFFTVLAACGVVLSVLLLPLWSITTNPKYATPKPLEPKPALDTKN